MMLKLEVVAEFFVRITVTDFAENLAVAESVEVANMNFLAAAELEEVAESMRFVMLVAAELAVAVELMKTEMLAVV